MRKLDKCAKLQANSHAGGVEMRVLRVVAFLLVLALVLSAGFGIYKVTNTYNGQETNPEANSLSVVEVVAEPSGSEPLEGAINITAPESGFMGESVEVSVSANVPESGYVALTNIFAGGVWHVQDTATHPEAPVANWVIPVHLWEMAEPGEEVTIAVYLYESGANGRLVATDSVVVIRPATDAVGESSSSAEGLEGEAVETNSPSKDSTVAQMKVYAPSPNWQNVGQSLDVTGEVWYTEADSYLTFTLQYADGNRYDYPQVLYASPGEVWHVVLEVPFGSPYILETSLHNTAGTIVATDSVGGIGVVGSTGELLEAISVEK